MKILDYIASLFQSKKVTNDEVLKIQKEAAALAIEHGRLYNIRLDYSDDSVKNVDRILAGLNKEHARSKNKTEVENLALLFGLYIIEVFERNHEKGYLERKLLGVEKDHFPYYWKGNLMFPCRWCLNKIVDTAADDVSQLYKNAVKSK